jgi:protein-S-isoprenylcysteine O-methyltransferase Ste14
MMERDVLLMSFIACILFYNYIGLYISRKHGAKISWWPSIIKSRDYTFYLIYITYITLLLIGIVSLFKGLYMLSLTILGFLLIILSIYINYLARRELAKHWSPLASSTKNQQLIKTGVYAKVRHPIYTSILVFLLGVAFISGSLYSFAFFVLFIIALGIRIRKEERELITKFGEEYKEYVEETSLLIPRLKWKQKR